MIQQSIIAAVVTVALYLTMMRFVAESVRGFGEFVGLREHSDDGVTYSPVIRFSGPGGRVV